VPGDSPVGYRLPLGTLPYVPPSEYPYIHPADPSIPRQPLAGSHRPAGRAMPEASRQHGRQQPEPRRAGRVERRNRRRRAHRDLGRAARRAALRLHAAGRAHRGLSRTDRRRRKRRRRTRPAVHIEGYSPPQDERINVIRVAPDPGVIEVNIHPASNWRDCVDITTAIYEEARQTRLGADKFMIDGRHTGTGGGNHVVVGGDKPRDSPFLRRPDLLKSLVLHWQRHPSLSYLFSGMFIGPTSQAPRIDEARHDSLYELEIAMAQVPPARRGAPRRCRGWSTGCSATSWSTSPATPTAPKSASTSSFRRMGRPAGSAWSNSAASKCRRCRACRWPSSCWSAR
jgi:uncharacterized protein (DUF2126 family)